MNLTKTGQMRLFRKKISFFVNHLENKIIS